MNVALGDNNGNMESNGEVFLIRQVLSSINKSDHEFVIFDVGANVGHWTTSLLNIAKEQGILNKLSVHCFEPSAFTFCNSIPIYRTLAAREIECVRLT